MSLDFERNIIKQCFNSRDVFLYILETIGDDDVFSDSICNTLWKIYMAINKEGFNLNGTSISDVIKHTNYDKLQESFDEIINSEYQDEQEWKYHLYIIQENYKKNILMSVSKRIDDEIHSSSSEEILNNIQDDIMNLQNTGIKTISMGAACMNTIEDIKNINEGLKQSYLKTGNNNFDRLVSLSPGKFILVAAIAKQGKSRWVIDLIDRLINNNEKVNVQWDTFEMRPEEVLKCFISRKTKFTNYKLDGKQGKLSLEDMDQIKIVAKYFGNYPIEFIGEHLTITAICTKFIKFCKEHKGQTNILVIDNLAYIKVENKDQGMFEDLVAKTLVQLRDKTNGIIILVHHLTKETDSKWNKDSGYEPKLAYVRGSKRLIDCPNQILLLHRPDAYPDLVQEAKEAGQYEKIKGLFVAQLEVNRDGETGIIEYQHNIQFSYFEER